LKFKLEKFFFYLKKKLLTFFWVYIFFFIFCIIFKSNCIIGAADLFQQFNNDTNGMAEIDERIDLYQQEQRAIQGRIKIKIQEIESGNLSLQLANGLKDWVLDIQETNKMSEDAAIEGKDNNV
tara:strand:- start:38 stop:406 length:369 start_codon:yes stop_codon:yes gene_type:complete